MTSAFYVKTLASKTANRTHQTFIRDVSMSSTITKQSPYSQVLYL